MPPKFHKDKGDFSVLGTAVKTLTQRETHHSHAQTQNRNGGGHHNDHQTLIENTLKHITKSKALTEGKMTRYLGVAAENYIRNRAKRHQFGEHNILGYRSQLHSKIMLQCDLPTTVGFDARCGLGITAHFFNQLRKALVYSLKFLTAVVGGLKNVDSQAILSRVGMD